MAEKTFHSITLPGQDTARVPLTAAEFSTSVAYKVKDYCTYQGKLYRCTTAHAAGAWNAAHFTATDVDAEFDRKLDIPASQATAPANPRVGDLWIDNDENSPIYNVDASPTLGSTNAVQSGGTKVALNSLDSRKMEHGVITGDFSASVDYRVGDLVFYTTTANGITTRTLYRCTTDHNSAAWNAAHFTATTLEVELQRVRDNEADTDMIGDLFGTKATYAVGDYCVYNDILYRCIQAVDNTGVATPAFNPDDWTQVALANDVSDLNSALSNIRPITQLEFIDNGYILNTGTSVDISTVVTNASWSYLLHECKEGDTIRITGNTPNTLARLWCFITNTGAILDRSAVGAIANNLVLTVPPGTKYLILNVRKDTKHLAETGAFDIYSDVVSATRGVTELTKLSLSFNADNSGWFIDQTLGYKRNNITSMWFSDLVRVEGDVYFNGIIPFSYQPSKNILCYDACKQYIGYIEKDVGFREMEKLELLDGTKYIRIQTLIDFVDTVSLYAYNVNNSYNDEYEEIPFNYVTNGYIGGLNDNPYDYEQSNQHLCTDYIPVPNEIYFNGIVAPRYINNTIIHALYAFDANYNVVGSYLLSESAVVKVYRMEKLVFPSNTAYIKFYVRSTAIDGRYTTQTYADTVALYYKKDYHRPENSNNVIGNQITSDMYLETFATFRKFGVCGDSLSVSFMQNPEDTSQIIGRALEYSWGQILARKYGNICLNFGRSGVSAKSFVSEYSSILLDNDNQCQVYIIGIGANDIPSAVGEGYGTVNDINWEDYTQNLNTFCGNYGRIIQMIHTVSPLAPIFIFTLGFPRSLASNTISVNPLIREIYNSAKSHINKIYLCDIENNYRPYYVALNKYDQGGHFTALGYRYASIVTNKVLCDTMMANITDFGNIGFIPYGSNNVIE